MHNVNVATVERTLQAHGYEPKTEWSSHATETTLSFRLDSAIVLVSIQESVILFALNLVSRLGVNAIHEIAERVHVHLPFGRVIPREEQPGAFCIDYARSHEGRIDDFDVAHSIEVIQATWSAFSRVCTQLGYEP